MASEPLGIEWVQSHKDVATALSFLDLPKELRDTVYQYAFQVPGALFIYCTDPYSWRPTLKGKIVKYKNKGPMEPQHVSGVIPIGLLRTCRQIHSEAAEVLYGRNVFQLYMTNLNYSETYRYLVRQVSFTMDANRDIFHHDLEVMGYWWRRRYWPSILDKSTSLLVRFPNLDTLTFPIKSDHVVRGVTWRPAFLAAHQKSKEHRIALAARWLAINCPIEDNRLRQILHLEIVPSTSLLKEDFEGSKFTMEEDAEWDGSELAEAFDEMKKFLLRQA
ncbi:hypothetical protein BU23DRAFT_200048 [Bimuria novae-zelandiae CBS 107.79]|uniref:DUF7730 domain-containing protein n=1 Tax=Bimuria novae-zelandiae CBS 107.79 TaxID=1447943 RepID=A0A6A5V248_9PLEO|nr:hypothetical protein BU23DRAFT_200048 [Bimuria novae-zelandiae CBS 107.79]